MKKPDINRLQRAAEHLIGMNPRDLVPVRGRGFGKSVIQEVERMRRKLMSDAAEDASFEETIAGSETGVNK